MCAHVCECLCVHAHLPVQCHFKLVVVVVIQSCPSLSDPMTVAHQAPRPWDSPDKNTGVKKKKKEYWSGLPFPSPVNFLNPGIEARSPALQTDSLWWELLGSPSFQNKPE